MVNMDSKPLQNPQKRKQNQTKPNRQKEKKKGVSRHSDSENTAL